MKRFIVPLSILILSVTTISCTDKKKEFRKMLAKECIETGDKQFSDSKVKAYFHQYCECSSEKMSEQISREEFTKMKEEGNDAALQAKIMPIVQPCLDEMEKKMNAGK